MGEQGRYSNAGEADDRDERIVVGQLKAYDI